MNNIFKGKLRGSVLLVFLGISLVLNVILIANNVSSSQAKSERKDCASYAWKEVQDRSFSGVTAREQTTDYLYEQCLKVRYGVTN